MKKSLLLLLVCLFGALSGVKAWTPAAPVAGKAYYLYNTTRGNYFQANTTGPYDLISDIAYATPVTMITGSESGKYYLEFKVGGTSYRLCHSAGTPQLTDWGHNYSISGSVNDGFEIKSHVKDKSTESARDRWFSAWDSYHCNFPKNRDENAYKWKFILAEDALAESGWEKVTSVEALKNQPENYLYAILSANNSSLIVRTDASTGHGYYRSMCAPLSSSEYLFSIENYIYDSKDYFVMKAENTNAYYHAENDAAFDLVAINQPSVDADCRLEFEYADNAWNIKTWTSYSGDPTCGSYWGLWDYNQGYADGKKMAGNKNENEKGSFLIYRIPKYNLDMTGRIYNHSFELDNVSDSKRAGAKGWTLPQTDGDTKVQLNSNETYTMTNADGNLFNTWNGDATGYTISQTIYNLPAGQYKVSAVMAAFGGQTLQLKANDVTGEKSSVDKGTGVEVTADVTLDAPGNIAISAKTAADAFYKVDNFRLTYYGTPATSADYTALQNAIKDAKAKTLGFDAGDYAPYNNVAVLNALAAAKSIDQNANNQQALTQSAIRAIANENWTVNSGEVNAIYDGTFSNAPIADATAGVNGWSAAEGLRQLVESNVEGSLVNKGMYVWGSNVVTYGETSGYQMPLKINTVYKLTYNRASWSGGTSSHTEVTITNPSGGALGIMSEDGNAGDWNATSGTLVSSTMYFVANEDGNYKISFSPWGNTVYTNLELKSTDETLTFADNSIPKYIPGTYPNVSYTRSGITLNKKRYATVFLPYSFSTTGLKVMEYSSREDEVLTFTPVDETVANTPYLVRVADGASDEDLTSLTLSGSGAVSAASGTSGDVFVGTYSPLKLYASADGYNYYGFSSKNGDFRRVSAGGNDCDAFRAYVKLPKTNNSRVVVRFDDETTGIVTLDASGNINGAEVMQDGKYLIDGKIVIVKNGVKYDANGKKLN